MVRPKRQYAAVRRGQLWREKYGRADRGGVKRSLVVYDVNGPTSDPTTLVCYYLWSEKDQRWVVPRSAKKVMMIRTLHEQWAKVGEDHIRIVDFSRSSR